MTILEVDNELKYADMKEQVRAYWKRKVKGSLNQDVGEAKALAAAEVKKQRGACFWVWTDGPHQGKLPKDYSWKGQRTFHRILPCVQRKGAQGGRML